VIEVYIESGSKRVFACAVDWPGWCRSAKDEKDALTTLAAYAPRYAPVARGARLPFKTAGEDFNVVQRLRGGASTDFGVPEKVTKADTRPLARAEAERLTALVKSAWAVFDRVAARAPAELRKGPRGGGRDRDKMVDHVLGAEGAYARKLGLRLEVPDRKDRRGVAAFRAAISDALRKPSKAGSEKSWPRRYAARRIAWHALDHAWEMQDRSQPVEG
jgi:hypothetical protein